jgi:hypothetical protein
VRKLFRRGNGDEELKPDGEFPIVISITKTRRRLLTYAVLKSIPKPKKSKIFKKSPKREEEYRER